MAKDKELNFFLVFCTSKKKFERYVKNNRISNKYVIDIKKILEEEKINKENPNMLIYFKVLIYKKFQIAIEKNKDIYYIPNFDDPSSNITDLVKLKNVLENHKFNLLAFYNDTKEIKKKDMHINILMQHLNIFDASQIIQDY